MTFGSDHRRAAFEALLAHLHAGGRVADHEGQYVDAKEDPSLRTRHGDPQTGDPRSEKAAKLVADAAACFACAEGGVVVLGIDDSGVGPPALRGTGVDDAWLSARVRQLVGVEVVVEVHHIEGTRILAAFVEPSPIPVKDTSHRYRRRYGRECQEIDPADLGSFSVGRTPGDWSSLPSRAVVSDVPTAVLEQLRTWLRVSGETSRIELADADDSTLLGRLGLCDPSARLNRAGELLCVEVATRTPVIDLSCRAAAGADTELRIDPLGTPLVPVLAAVEEAIDARNPTYPVGGLVVGQIRALPVLAVREALVNAIVHRDWARPGPVRVELEGASLTVTSPGGFLPGITEDTVITAPPRSRNPTLAGAFRSLRLAEAEGSGVDRMFRETVRIGLPRPAIREGPDGSFVRCALVGGRPDPAVIGVVASLGPPLDRDVDVLLLLDALTTRASINATALAPIIQKSRTEASAALRRARAAGLVVETTRIGHHRLADRHRQALRARLPYLRTTQAEYEQVIKGLLESHGEVRARDIVDLLGVHPGQASRVLAAAVESGLLVRRPTADAVGAGVHYVAAEPEPR